MATTARLGRTAHPAKTLDAIRRGALSEEEFLAKVKDGVFYDRFDELMPLDVYGPPMADELPAVARQAGEATGTASAVPSNGRDRRARRAPARKRR